MKKLLLVCSTILFVACKVHQTTPTGGTASSESVVISEDTARKMVRKYHPHSVGLRVQTRTIWLSKDRIKLMYDELQQDTPNIKSDGLRIYLAKYPKIKSQNGKYEYAFHNTLVFVSTKDSIRHVIGKKLQDSIIHTHWDYFIGKQKRGIYFIQNKGELTPPGDEEGALLLHP